MAEWPTPNSPLGTPISTGFGNQVSVSTETPLQALTEYGTNNEAVRFVLKNQGANAVYLVVDRSEDGVVADVDRPEVKVPAGKQGSILFENLMHLYLGASAYSDPDLAYPATNVRLKVVRRRRQ